MTTRPTPGPLTAPPAGPGWTEQDRQREAELLACAFNALAEGQPGALEFVTGIGGELFYDHRHQAFLAGLKAAARTFMPTGDLGADSGEVMKRILAELATRGEAHPLNQEYWRAIPEAFPTGSLAMAKRLICDLVPVYSMRRARVRLEVIADAIKAKAHPADLARKFESGANELRVIAARAAALEGEVANG